MSGEQSRERRAAVHAALGEPARLAIADALVLGDASPSELARGLGLSSNLLAHHLSVLEAAGVIDRLRSEADRRRTYVRLAAAAVPLVSPGPLLRSELLKRSASLDPARVVFVCTHNSARSQLAAALWARRTTVPVASAGTHPAPRVHPQAVAVARRHGLELRQARTSHVDDVLKPDDLVVSVCDRVYEEMGADTVRVHWSIPDPVRRGVSSAFDEAYDSVDERIDRLAAVVGSEASSAS